MSKDLAVSLVKR